jgi:hypothetical protein
VRERVALRIHGTSMQFHSFDFRQCPTQNIQVILFFLQRFPYRRSEQKLCNGKFVPLPLYLQLVHATAAAAAPWEEEVLCESSAILQLIERRDGNFRLFWHIKGGVLGR